MSKKEIKSKFTDEDISSIALTIKETSHKINPVRPSDVFVPLLQHYPEQDRIRIRKEVERMLRDSPTLGYLINNGKADNFNKWLGAVRDTKLTDLKREMSHWTESLVSALEKDRKSFDENEETE